MTRKNKDKLDFPVKTHKVTDKYGNVTYHKTRQTTIGKYIWTDADIEYYEKLNKLMAKAKRLNNKIDKACEGVTLKPITNADIVEQLIEEIENEVTQKE